MKSDVPSGIPASNSGLIEHLNRSTNALTVKKLATLLSLAPITIYKMVERGALPALKIPGGSIRFDGPAIARVLTGKQASRMNLGEN
jgi:excisionase family DNA binding protein